MLLLGIDLGTSAVKVSVLDADSRICLASESYPEQEAEIISLQPGWAEQSPDSWWDHVQKAILKLLASGLFPSAEIAAIGIAYQMHGLVLVDKDQKVLRNAIIWCDSRAVPYGGEAFDKIGAEKCFSHLLNSPGNFTAAKLAWVKNQEPELYAKIDRILLPGDFIAMKLTGHSTTTVSALSEGIFWDFRENQLSRDVMDFYGFPDSVIPELRDVFAIHGLLEKKLADRLGLPAGIPVSYKAGDQLNNALSLNIFEPGEVAATAGTSGVLYGISDQLYYDRESRINSFAHVNYAATRKRIGVLLCINGTGILNRWLKNLVGNQLDYETLNKRAEKIPRGSEGLLVFPFGNGAERMLQNRIPGAQIQKIDLNRHTPDHLYRAGQEGIALAFRYGFDIMRENGIRPQVIRAGSANMFLSSIFTETLVNLIKVPVELFDTEGSAGAAIGAGIGAKLYASPQDAFSRIRPARLLEPSDSLNFEELYGEWKSLLLKSLQADSPL